MEPLPVDKGWAWVICFAGFLVHTLLGSSGQVNTMMLSSLIEKFDTTITTISLMFTVGIMCFSFFSTVSANVFLPKFGERKCVIFGGILTSLSSIGQGLSTHVAGIIVLEGLRGTGHGILFVPAMCLIRQYFKRLRSTASVIVFCGGCVAAIVAPFIIAAVSKEYGVTGTYLLLGAVELHYCVSGLLLRPVTSYRKTVENSPEVELNQLPTIQVTPPPSQESSQVQSQTISNGSSYPLKNLPLDAEVRETLLDKALIVEEPIVRPRVFSRGMSVDSTDTYLSDKYKQRATFGSVLTLTSEHGAVLETVLDKEDTKSRDDPDTGVTNVGVFRKCYNEASLNLWSMRLAMVAIMPGTVHVYIAIYTPMILHSQGASLDELSTLLTLLGVLDLVSRLGMGFLADTHIVSATVMFILSQMFLGVLCQFVGFFSMFETLIVYVILLGLVIGARVSLLPLVVIEVVGVDKMPQAFSIISLVATITAAGVNPLFGAITEATGSFIVALHIVGACFCFGAAMWILVPRLVQLDIKKGRRD
ncbi:uncharacterized protein LOC106051431 [Biomphalaria glabrata]|uniref:Uncharacterized protein LOC106051431 n=1 Tax=Biomphalaria glabrata TaxID=6526 RepID=A0A9W3BNT6_BIOGL|nr:uncharacterized protein LOC106051431 [Biomphalaria glabrata]